MESANGPTTLTFSAEGEPQPTENPIRLEKPTLTHNAILEAKGKAFEDALDLSDINGPQIEVRITDCDVSTILLSGSRFASVVLRGLSTSRGPIYVGAQETKVDGLFAIYGSGRNRTDGGRLFDVYGSINGHRLEAGHLEVWGVDFLGAVFLDIVRQHDNTHYNDLFRFYSRALKLSDASLGSFIGFDCKFTGLVSLRGAKIIRRTKFEECLFEGHTLEFLEENEQHPGVRDDFDNDDVRSLYGLVLDLSRAQLGTELIFRNIDGMSRGWMNWSHAKATNLNDDTTLWNGETSGSPKHRLRFRLNGFCYDALVEREIDAKNVLNLGETAPSSERSRLVGSTTGRKHDPNEESRPEPSRGTREGKSDASTRIQWLRCQLRPDLTHRFMAQPWTEAAKAFRTQGDYYSANMILLEREKGAHNALGWKILRDGKTKPINQFERIVVWLFHWIFSRPSGFGYRLWLPVLLAAIVWYAGALEYRSAKDKGLLMKNPEAAKGKTQLPTGHTELENGWRFTLNDVLPTLIAPAHANGACQIKKECPACVIPKPQVCAASAPDSAPSGKGALQDPDGLVPPTGAPPGKQDTVPSNRYTDYPDFDEYAYSFDVMLPGVDISQGVYWIPGFDSAEAATDGVNDAKGSKDAALRRVWWLYWGQMAAGWYLTIVLALGGTGFLERKS